MPAFLILTCHSVILFTLVTVFIELGQGHHQVASQIPWNTLKAVLKNPIILGLVIGFLFNLLGWTIPHFLETMIGMLSQAALPCAIFAMGGALSAYRLMGHLPEALTIVGIKLILHPLLVWFLANFIFDVPSLWMAVAVIMAGVPSGINTYMFADRYQAGVPTAATAILVSTGLSVFSLTGLLVLFAK